MQCNPWGRHPACQRTTVLSSAHAALSRAVMSAFSAGWKPAPLLLVAVLLAAGCSASSDQVASCQADKEQLLTTIRNQRDANRQMTEQVASLESRLDEAEKELARRSPAGTRLSSRPVEVAPLPWRSPASSTPTRRASEGATASRSASAGFLAALAQRDQRLTIDRQSGAARYETDIAFEPSSANLTAEGRRQLDELARLLKGKDAAELRVMVSGYAEGRPAAQGEADARFASARQLGAARAQAVADYLDSHGIAEERLGVTGVGSPGPRGSSATDRLASGGVQIHLLEPDVPVLGWGPAGEAIRR